MTDQTLYAVFIHPAAIEALGEPIKPYLSTGVHGPHVVCREIDSGGAFFEMTIEGRDNAGRLVEVEVMIPSAMVQMVVSTHSDGLFGFHDNQDDDAGLLPGFPGIAPAQPATRDPLPHEPAMTPATAAGTANPPKSD